MKPNDQTFIVQKIRTQYTEKSETQLDALRALDAKVKRPANIFAYSFGSLGAVIMGAGMSLVMTDLASVLEISQPMVLGIGIGMAGMAMAVANYPIYKKILESRKKCYAQEIVALSDAILGE